MFAKPTDIQGLANKFNKSSILWQQAANEELSVIEGNYLSQAVTQSTVVSPASTYSYEIQYAYTTCKCIINAI